MPRPKSAGLLNVRPGVGLPWNWQRARQLIDGLRRLQVILLANNEKEIVITMFPLSLRGDYFGAHITVNVDTGVVGCHVFDSTGQLRSHVESRNDATLYYLHC